MPREKAGKVIRILLALRRHMRRRRSTTSALAGPSTDREMCRLGQRYAWSRSVGSERAVRCRLVVVRMSGAMRRLCGDYAGFGYAGFGGYD